MLSAEMHRENREATREGSYGRFLYNYFRYYGPSIGRYINADPIGQAGGWNTYLYADSIPTGSTDPFGLKPSALGSPYGRASQSAGSSSSGSTSFLAQAVQNFKSTNSVIPGIVAPPLASGVSGISGKVAAGRGVKTLAALALQALKNPSSVTAAAAAGTAQATAIAWAAAAVSWEAGVAAGSLVAAIPVPGGPGETVGTFFGNLLFEYLNPPCGTVGSSASGAAPGGI